MDTTEALRQATERAAASGRPAYVVARVGTNQFDIFDSLPAHGEEVRVLCCIAPDGSQTAARVPETANRAKKPLYAVVVSRYRDDMPSAAATAYRVFGPLRRFDAAALCIKMAGHSDVMEAHIVPLDRLGIYIQEHPLASTHPERLAALVRFMTLFGPPFTIGLSKPRQTPKEDR